MTEKEKNLQSLMDSGIVAIVRANTSEGLLRVVEAIEKGGVRAIEVTMTTPKAIETIAAVTEKYQGDVLVGVGTVLDEATARMAILAGAKFVVAPNLNEEVVRTARRYSRIVMPGAFTPTEIVRAWEAGADVVKVFPTSSVGPDYIKDLKGPLPHISMLPTGGVTVDNAGAFIKAGACAVAVGGNLASANAISEGRYEEITQNAARFVEAVKKARAK
ncbi:MAG TPA: bifunctional 2-keto-4-hydroxyglutarate aldolase/2-keto-3-deoxy-6-phosphogluconate aldolase [bacterium]|nr:bifunctional 2-keto-4-hydroxyglutarate aldolase/2-keto-3-deoxy-6-phosphogluconate aldolase [bacterium]